MRITLYKYIAQEIWPTLGTSLLVFVFIVLAARMLKLSEWMITFGVPLADVMKMVVFLLPSIILFALPAAMLMAVLVAFLRLSSDNEILALKSSGISLYQMLPPVLTVAAVVGVSAALIGIFGAPWASRSFRDLVLRIAQSKADLGLKERVFCEPFGDVTFFVNSFSPGEKIMNDVFLVDRRDPSSASTIVAKEGRIINHPRSSMITIRFIDGTIFTVEKRNHEARTIQFNTYDLNIDPIDLMPPDSSRKRSPREMDLHELIEKVRQATEKGPDYREMAMEMMGRFSVPLAIFLMGVIGASLGAHVKSGGRLLGIGISLGVFLSYYLFLAGVKSLGETGTLSPFWGTWIPDFFLIALSLWLTRRAGEERSISMMERAIAVRG